MSYILDRACRGDVAQCGYFNAYTKDVCAVCGTFRTDRAAEIHSRVAALLQTCDRSKTTLRQLLARMKLEGGSPFGGLCITSKELEIALDHQLFQRGGYRLSSVC
jgi:hypothetical protein